MRYKKIAGLAIFAVTATFLYRSYFHSKGAENSSSLKSASSLARQSDEGLIRNQEKSMVAEVSSQRAPSAIPPSQNSGPLNKAQKSPLMNLLKRKNPNANWNISFDTNQRPAHITGGKIKVTAGASGVSKLLMEVSSSIGVDPSQLRQGPRTEGADTATENNLVHYIGNFRVFNSQISAFSNPKTNEVFHIANELRPMESSDTRLLINKTEALKKVAELYYHNKTVSYRAMEEPVLFESSPNKFELSWQIQVHASSPKLISVELLVSALDGRVLRTHNALSK